MPVWNIQLDNGDIMEVEADTQPTKEEVMQYIANERSDEDKQAFVADDAYPEYNDFGQELLRKGKGLGKFEDYDELTGWSGDATALYSSFAHGLTLGLSDVGASVLAPEELETWELARKNNPVYSGVGEVGGILTNAIATKGMGLYAAGGAAGGLAQGMAAKAGAGKAGQWIAKEGARAVVEGTGALAEANFIKTADAVAGTREWDEAKQGWLDFATDTPAAVALAFAGNTIVNPMLKYAFSPSYRAMRIIGQDALNAGRYEYEIALASGVPAGKAGMLAKQKVYEKLDPKTLSRVQQIASTNPDFAQVLNEQILGPYNKIFLNSMRALTGAQTAEYSKIFNDRLYGPNYRNQLGATSPDFSVGGVLNSMGINVDPTNTAHFLFTPKAADVRSAALQGAQEHILKNIHNDGFWAGRQKMAELGTGLLSKMDNSTKNSFLNKLAMASEDELTKRTTPEATQKALSAYKSRLDDIVEEIAQNNPNMSPADALFEARRTYVKNLLETGSDDIFEIDALRGMLKTVFKKEIEEGMGIISSYESGIINNVLDNPALVGSDASGLFMTNQSLRWGNKVLQTFDLANDFVSKGVKIYEGAPTAETAKKAAKESLEGILTYLNQGTDAENTIVRKALFKGAIANRFQNAIKSGNTTEANMIREWAKKGGELVKNNIFRPGEFDDYYKKMMPQIKAHKNIRAIIKATNPQQYSAGPEVAENIANSTAALATTGMSANAFRYGIKNFWDHAKFGGPETAKYVNQYLANPSWNNFNTMFREIKDTNVRNFFEKMIQEGLKQATEFNQMAASSPVRAMEVELWK